ncbi:MULTISPECIES: TIGR00282 family metallophosphoesterase [Deinococcus]|uniref:YmdB family metallophosphoesterase n=1 Tax=Deinococcus rufus TaxID=2136097 RepID=A0ABV7ZBX4_9DEIO|nr:TIGR00282 family metallophosphoesterase [Deinococcus sp. AB2017081]WQE94303.1 TIGR00282 family metallophosphoesterase [Deinococcus sp. AB2017081]
MMRVVFVGDVFGQPGRRVLAAQLPGLRKQAEFAIVNMENSAGGFGMHRDAADGALAAGADCLTLGNHAWHHKDIYALMGDELKYPIVRPLNLSDPGAPGVGWRSFDVTTPGGTERLTVVNVLGRVFMEAVANPFRAMDDLLARDDLGAVFVDMHAEATSEKQALAWHLDGRVAAVIGTHTHVPTADTRLLPGGTAFQADVGFTGPHDSVIGSDAAAPIQKFLTERPHRFGVASGRAELNAVFVQIEDGRAVGIERYRYVEE